jgi:thiol-disulfide isomerase/thioredoxin
MFGWNGFGLPKRLINAKTDWRLAQRWLVAVLLFCALSAPAAAEHFSLFDAADNEINVERMPAQGDLLVIWLTDHEEERKPFEAMLQAVNAAGIEVWRVDLLADYFLPRSSENIRTLKGDGVEALLQAAHTRSDKRILLAAYDRMPLPMLRGVRQWRLSRHEPSRLLGAVLYYPNLFGPPPVAGKQPILDPIVSASNIPLTLYQPANGPQRWRLPEVMQAFWSAGSPALAYLVKDSRDWFFMHPPERAGAGGIAATKEIPHMLLALADLMAGLPQAKQTAGLPARQAETKRVRELVSFEQGETASDFRLKDVFSGDIGLKDYQGKVTLVNFWATWCPPCVEEIPSLNQLAEHFGAEDFAIVSIDFRESEQQIREFAERVPVAFPVLLDSDGKTSLAWKVFSFPSSFILDRQGRIRYSVNRAIDWNTPEVRALIAKLLAEPAAGASAR